MNTFHLRIVTMDGKVFDDQASQIFLRTIDGDVAIRAGHINYCSGIGMGQAHVTLADGHERYAACIGGMVSMLNGECQVAATTWEWKEEGSSCPGPCNVSFPSPVSIKLSMHSTRAKAYDGQWPSVSTRHARA